MNVFVVFCSDKSLSNIGNPEFVMVFEDKIVALKFAEQRNSERSGYEYWVEQHEVI